MAKCYIGKYDKLPARVGWIDVDYLRFRLSQNLDDYKKIRAKLEEAVKKNEKRNI